MTSSSIDTAPGTPIAIPQVPNLRDLGGWETTDGRVVARRLVCRATHLHEAAGTAVEDLGLSAIVDLRRAEETAAAPDAPIAPIILADVFADQPLSAGVDIVALMADPKGMAAATENFGVEAATKFMTDAYRSFTKPGSAADAYRTLLETIAETESPVLFHCTAGKDRTGWGAAVLLLLLGVPLATVEHEYLLTNDQLLPSYGPMFAAFTAHGGDTAILTALFGVQLPYLHAALQEMTATYGDVQTYATQGLGLNAATLARLRARLAA